MFPTGIISRGMSRFLFVIFWGVDLQKDRTEGLPFEISSALNIFFQIVLFEVQPPTPPHPLYMPMQIWIQVGHDHVEKSATEITNTVTLLGCIV